MKQIRMIQPRIMKKYGTRNNMHFYRFVLTGKGLLNTTCHTWATGVRDLKEKSDKIIKQFESRQLELIHAKFKNGIRP